MSEGQLKASIQKALFHDDLKTQLSSQFPYVKWNKNTILLDEILNQQKISEVRTERISA